MQEEKLTPYISEAMPDELNSSGIFRYALGVEYRGTQYCGWQRQELQGAAVINRTVQNELETALSFVANHQVATTCAGRTDSGVHAFEQVVHFETTACRPLKAWILGVHSYLPEDISICWVKQVPNNFHARFSATARTYHYWIDNRRQRPAIFRDVLTWIHQPLDVERMQEGAQYLLGENDFSSFRGSSCQSRTPIRNMKKITVQQKGGKILIEVTANAFLYHMVRNIVGSLLQVGRGLQKPVWIKETLALKDRRKASITAPANGLFLVHIEYPEEFNLPQAKFNNASPSAQLGPNFC